jgi:hypothetical protein
MSTETPNTDGAGKPAEDTQKAQTDTYKGSLDQGSFDKVWSANRANEAQSHELELKLKKFEDDKAQADRTREEALLKSKNDFEGLAKLHQTEHEKAINAAKGLIVTNFMTLLAVKHGLQDPADIALFNAEVELDDNYSVTNAKDVEKQFEDFKKKKSYLFSTEKKPVPKTDNLPIHQQDGSTDNLSKEAKLQMGTQAVIDSYNRRHAAQ